MVEILQFKVKNILHPSFDSCLKFETFCEQQEVFQRAYVKKSQNHVNLPVSQNAGFKLFNAWILKGNQMVYS